MIDLTDSTLLGAVRLTKLAFFDDLEKTNAQPSAKFSPFTSLLLIGIQAENYWQTSQDNQVAEFSD
jgi:hypothetical protein